MSNPILFVNTSESNVNVTESTTVTGDLNVTGGGELRVINADNAVAQISAYGSNQGTGPVWPTPPNL